LSASCSRHNIRQRKNFRRLKCYGISAIEGKRFSVSSETVVIGGGVVGTAVAYYLAKAGHPVTVVDQGRHGGACSHANCGYVSPSHVPPLAQPGVIGPALRSMLSS